MTDKSKQHLTTTVHSIIDAANSRNFNISSPPWNNFSQAFTALPGLLDKPPGTMTLQQFLPWFEEMCKTYPDFWLKVVDVRVQVKEDRAECFVSLEYNGLPKGVTRPGVGTFDFEKEEDESWVCGRLVTVGGLLGDGGDL